MNPRPIEIFWGTGGVGKTTLATSRALFLSKQNKKVLLIGIDPSKRLKQIFGTEDSSMGKIINTDFFDLLIFTPEETFKRILRKDDVTARLNNRIINILMRPYGGMNEIIAILEVQHQLKSKKYDTIVLDTPPGKHFIDFAKGSQKINKFFDKKFIESVKYLVPNMDFKTKNIFNLMAKTGINMVLKYMKIIIGEKFTEEFSDAIRGLYDNKEIFLSALDFEKNFQKDNFCHWFLTTSSERNRLKEVVSLRDEMEKDFHCDECLIVNKSLKSYLDNWIAKNGDPLYDIKKTMNEGESHMIQLAEASFKKVIVFPEILSSSPRQHIEKLSAHWENNMSCKIQTKADLEKFISSNWNNVNDYIDELSASLPIPIYSSVDIRESKTKFSPVDHNIYPAGFNNICSLDLNNCSMAFLKYIKKTNPIAKTLGIVPESNTKNKNYLDHLIFLGKCLHDAGYEIKYISLDKNIFPNGQNSIDLFGHSQLTIKLHQGLIEKGRLLADGQKIDFIVLNHDQSSQLIVDWDNLEVPVAPTPKIGWFNRHKGRHFFYYREIVSLFCKKFLIEPDLIQAKFKEEQQVDFLSRKGLERIGKKIDDLVEEIGKGASVFVKGGKGTYGMGISVVSSGEEIVKMNRKKLNKMDKGKNKIKFTSVIMQECVETILRYDDMPAEVVIYLIDGQPLGGFMRANSKKDAFSNLNSQGTVFKKYCISEIRQNCDHQSKEAVYSIIARLATLAGGIRNQGSFVAGEKFHELNDGCKNQTLLTP